MAEGLDGVVAAATILSDVDGEAGRLIIKGHSLDELAGRTTAEQALHLLFDGLFDDLPSAEALGRALGEARDAVFAQVAVLDEALLTLDPMAAMRALVARLDDGSGLQTALRLVAAPAVFTPALLRARAGQVPLRPDASAGHGADVLRMLRGAFPSPAEAAALDTYLVTVCDHGLNASTFAARVVASTRAGLTSAVLAGLSALKGPLHGGAPGPVIAMLNEIGETRNARPWLEQALARGDRLMGFGHRIYRVRDPRADALKGAMAALRQDAGRLSFAEAVEVAALAILRERKPDRALQTNVEFYTALLLEALGFPADAFTCVFAMGRTMGWIAHAQEQIASGRLIRPQSRYVGTLPKRAA